MFFSSAGARPRSLAARRARRDRGERGPLHRQVADAWILARSTGRPIREQFQSRPGDAGGTKAGHAHVRGAEPIQARLCWSRVHGLLRNAQPQRSIEGEASAAGAHRQSGMVDAEEGLVGRRCARSLLPLGISMTRRKPQELQRMAVGVTKLERPHAAARCRQSFRALGADRPPSRARPKPGVGRVHVAYDDGEMLKPQVVAAAVRRIIPPARLTMHEHEIFLAEAQPELAGIALEPHGLQNLRIGRCAR